MATRYYEELVSIPNFIMEGSKCFNVNRYRESKHRQCIFGAWHFSVRCQ